MDSFTSLFNQQFIYALGWSIVHSFWQCLLVFSLLCIGLLLNKRARPETRYWLAMVALLCCLLISVKTFIYCYQDINQASQLFSKLQQVFTHTPAHSWWAVIYQNINPWLDSIVLIWCAGFTIQALRYVTDVVLTQRLTQQAVTAVPQQWQSRFHALAQQLQLHKSIQFLQSTKVLIPCVIGHLKPVVLLPLGMLSQLPHEQIEAILLHELAHIKRHDYLLNIIQCLVKVLFFFNPFVLAISKKIDVERENACDDLAVKISGEPLIFAQSLSRFADITNHNQSAIAASKDQYLLLARVKRLFAQPNRLSYSTERLIALGCAGFLALTLNTHASSQVQTISPQPGINSKQEPLTQDTVEQTISEGMAEQKIAQQTLNSAALTESGTINKVPPITNVKQQKEDLPVEHSSAETLELAQTQPTIDKRALLLATAPNTAYVSQPGKTMLAASKPQMPKTIVPSAASDYVTQSNKLTLATNIEEAELDEKGTNVVGIVEVDSTQQLIQFNNLLSPNNRFSNGLLMAIPAEQLRTFKHIVFAPVDVKNVRLKSGFEDWKKATRTFLPSLPTQDFSVMRITDKTFLSQNQYNEITTTPLIAQLRLQQASYIKLRDCVNTGVDGKDWNTNSNDDYGTSMRAIRPVKVCNGASQIQGDFEIVIIHPVSKDILFAGHFSHGNRTRYNEGHNFSIERWQEQIQTPFWHELLAQSQTIVAGAVEQAQQNKPDETQLMLRDSDFQVDLTHMDLPQLASPYFERLHSVEHTQLAPFSHILFAPIVTDNARVATNSTKWQKWVESTEDYLPQLPQQPYSISLLTDQQADGEHSVSMESVLVAQIKLTQVLHDTEKKCLTGKPFIKREIVERLPRDFVPARPFSYRNNQHCKYADIFEHKIELVVIHPVTKAILIYAETSLETFGNFSLDEHFDLDKLQAEQQAAYWQYATQQIKAQIAEVVTQIQTPAFVAHVI